MIGDNEPICSQFGINYGFFNNSHKEEKKGPSNKPQQPQYRAKQRKMKKLEIMEKEVTISPDEHLRQQEEQKEQLHQRRVEKKERKGA